MAWRFWKFIGYTLLFVPVLGAVEIMREEFAMRRWPTLAGLFPHFGLQPAVVSYNNESLSLKETVFKRCFSERQRLKYSLVMPLSQPDSEMLNGVMIQSQKWM